MYLRGTPQRDGAGGGAVDSDSAGRWCSSLTADCLPDQVRDLSVRWAMSFVVSGMKQEKEEKRGGDGATTDERRGEGETSERGLRLVESV